MNADPRRPDKVQRYVPNKNSANGEDLTPDYMNIMGQPATTAANSADKLEANDITMPNSLQPDELVVTTTNAANVIPTSPQYGVAIIPNSSDISETIQIQPDSLVDSKPDGDGNKELHSTPSRNERFKVVKIASLEPFKRGRWKCMDYVDEAPPANVANVQKSAQSVGNPMPTAVYLQTQSLPQQQIQQMLLQGGFTANGTQFYTPTQIIPSGQTYFYPQGQAAPTQFVNQPYFTAGVVNPTGFTLPQSYPNIQYVPIPTQGSAFVPAATAANFQQQQSQSFSGPPSGTNLVNGHAYPEPTAQSTTKVVVNSQTTQQPQYQQQQQIPQQSVAPTFQQQQQPPIQSTAPAQQSQPPPQQQQQQQTQQNFDANNVYTNPQFAMSVNSITVLDPVEAGTDVKETNSVVETVASDNIDDPNKNPVVNAIDNKIEQAMDLVKSHLMYTVREEVEVLKEKIAELMERIQQLETENNFLRTQIPKSAAPPPSSVVVPTVTANTNPVPPPTNVAIVNPNPQQPQNIVVPTSSSQNQAIPNNIITTQLQQQPTNKEQSTVQQQ